MSAYMGTNCPTPKGEPEPLSDEQVVELVRRGARRLFAIIMQRHKNRLFGIAYKITGNFSDAEDVVQETFCRALTKLEQFDGRGRFSSWLARIAFHESLGRRRVQYRLCWDERDPDTLATPSKCHSLRRSPCPEQAAMASQLSALIMKALDQLPGHFRSVFVMRAIQERTTAETAALLDIRPETVKTRFHRAKRLLKDELGRKFTAR